MYIMNIDRLQQILNMFKKFDFFFDKVKYNEYFFFFQIYNEKVQFLFFQLKEVVIKVEKRLMLVLVMFILICIWGIFCFIFYIFVGVYSLNIIYGIVFFYLQVSLL